MEEFLPMIREAEYAMFRSIDGMAEPPAKLGLPPTYEVWKERHEAAEKRLAMRRFDVLALAGHRSCRSILVNRASQRRLVNSVSSIWPRAIAGPKARLFKPAMWQSAGSGLLADAGR